MSDNTEERLTIIEINQAEMKAQQEVLKNVQEKQEKRIEKIEEYKDKSIETDYEIKASIKDSIEKLVKWADALNRQKYSGRIIIKAYNCMTLDFYWRLDDELFIGPYWLGEDSSTTITYKFKEGGKGFSRYSEYFERLWEYSDFSILTELKTFPAKKQVHKPGRKHK